MPLAPPHLGWHPLLGYHVAVLVFSSLLLVNTLFNLLFFFRRPRAALLPDHELPMISVLVPARNEEQHIEGCVRSLLAQNYPHFEVVVLDDNSDDTTYDILCHLRDEDPRLRVLVGAELPEGWCGKPFACWQLAKAAQGGYLLFTDADCRLAPDALLFAMGAQIKHRADVVSLMPNYVCVTFWEKLILPLLAYIPLAFLPIGLIRGTKYPVFSGANGAFLFMTREVYFELDGHEAVRGELAEDIKFSQHVKRRGRAMWYGDGHHVYKVRMYDGLGAIWRGFTRNLFPAFSHNLGLLTAALIMIAAVFVLPVVWFATGFFMLNAWMWTALLAYLITVAIRLSIAFRLENDDLFYAWLNPVAWAIVIAIAFGSVWMARGPGAEWKGRIYTSASQEPGRRSARRH